MRLFKVVVNDALHNGLIENNPFGNYKIRRIEGDREHLTEKEVKKLQNIYINKELKSNMHNVLHYFLFSCYTGLSFVDLKELQKKDIVQTEKEKKIISIKRSKTGTQVLVPLNVWCYEQVCLAECSNLTQMLLANLLIARVMRMCGGYLAQNLNWNTKRKI